MSRFAFVVLNATIKLGYASKFWYLLVQMVPIGRGRYDLGDPVNGELADFCDAMDDATQKTVLRRAFTEYMKRMLKENEGIRERYEALRRARRERNGTIPRLVKPEKGR